VAHAFYRNSRTAYPILERGSVNVDVEEISHNNCNEVDRSTVGDLQFSWLHSPIGIVRPIISPTGCVAALDDILAAPVANLLGSSAAKAGAWWADHPASRDMSLHHPHMWSPLPSAGADDWWHHKNVVRWSRRDEGIAHLEIWARTKQLILVDGVLHKLAPRPGYRLALINKVPAMEEWIDPIPPPSPTAALYFDQQELARAESCAAILSTEVPFVGSEYNSHLTQSAASSKTLRALIGVLVLNGFGKGKKRSLLEDAIEAVRQLESSSKSLFDPDEEATFRKAIAALMSAVVNSKNPKLIEINRLLYAYAYSDEYEHDMEALLDI
jgi:hypothetical protein